jgi:hypothetical protein
VCNYLVPGRRLGDETMQEPIDEPAAAAVLAESRAPHAEADQ